MPIKQAMEQRQRRERNRAAPRRETPARAARAGAPDEAAAARQLAALQRLIQEQASTLDVGRLLGAVMRKAAATLEAGHGFIALREPKTPAYRVIAQIGLESLALEELERRIGEAGEGIIAGALEEGRPCVVHDLESQPDAGVARICPGARSALAAPILYLGEVVGLICVLSEQPEHFQGQSLAFLETLSKQASVAVGNEQRYVEQVRQRDALHRRAEQLAHLFRITQDARSDSPIEGVLEEAAYGIQESVGFNVAVFSIVEGDPPTLRRAAAAGLPLKTFEQLQAERQPADVLETLLREEYRVGAQAYFFPHERISDWDVGIQALTATRRDEEPAGEDEWHPNDMLLIPLWGRERELLGVLSVDDPRDRRRPDPETIATLEVFAGQAAIAVENRRLFELERQRAEVAEAMLRVAGTLSASLEPGRILQTTVDEMARLFRAEQCSVILFDGQGQFGHIVAQHVALEDGEAVPFRVTLSGNPLMQRLIAGKAPIAVHDVSADPLTRPMREVLQLRRVKSLLAIPLVVRNKVIGLIDLDTTRAHRRFRPEEISQCQLIANQVAAAMENARLYDEVWAFSRQLELRVEERTRELRRERDRVEALYRISNELTTSLDLERVMQQALELLQEAVGSTEGLIMLIDPATDYMVIRAAIGRPTPVPRGGIVTQLKRGAGLAGWVVDQRQPVIVPDTSRDPRWTDLPGMTYPPRAALAAPLMAGEDVLGVVFLYHEQLGYFEESHLTLVTAAATKVAAAISNAELYRLITDQAERLGGMLRQQREESSRNKAILESIADGVLVNDVYGRVILMNAAAERILDTRASSALGQDVRNFFAAAAPEDREQAVRAINDLLRESAEPRAIQNQLDMGGKIVSMSLAPVRTSRRELLGLVTVLRDVTREVEADRAKSEFISTVSHELRTPMTSIKGYTDLLALGAVGELNEAQRRFLTIVQENSNRLTVLINDLLDISRIETGRIELNLAPIQIEELIASVVESMQGSIEGRGQKLTMELPEWLPAVAGDRDRLTQVLMNLISNATLYTDPGGEITIRAYAADSAIAVEVRDTGIGIAAEDIGKIFDRFYRGDSQRVQECQGTGLGLAIVKSFVEMHGGRIWVDSRPGQGSAFTFTLPCDQPARGG